MSFVAAFVLMSGFGGTVLADGQDWVRDKANQAYWEDVLDEVMRRRKAGGDSALDADLAAWINQAKVDNPLMGQVLLSRRGQFAVDQKRYEDAYRYFQESPNGAASGLPESQVIAALETGRELTAVQVEMAAEWMSKTDAANLLSDDARNIPKADDPKTILGMAHYRRAWIMKGQGYKNIPQAHYLREVTVLPDSTFRSFLMARVYGFELEKTPDNHEVAVQHAFKAKRTVIGELAKLETERLLGDLGHTDKITVEFRDGKSVQIREACALCLKYGG